MGANETGLHGEVLAAEFLTRRGYRVIDRNYHSRYGEVDIIALSDAYIVFVEVKVRQAGGKLHPLETVSPSECRKLVSGMCSLSDGQTMLAFDCAQLLGSSY